MSTGTRPMTLVAAAAMLLCAQVCAQQLTAVTGFTDYPKPWPLRHLVKSGVLTVGTTGRSANASFVNEEGTLAGSSIELWQKIASDLGLQPRFVVIDWPGILPGLVANRFDLACESASWTAERLGSPDFLMTRPIGVEYNIGVVRKISGIAGWGDITHRRLGGVRGEQELTDLIAKAGGSPAALELPGVTEGRLALLNGQIEVFAATRGVADQLLKGPDGDQLAMLPEPLRISPYGFCVNRNAPDLAQAINVLIAKYRADGSLQAIRKKWGQPDTSDLLTALGY